MTWQIPWPEFLKKRLCRYLLQHYLGHFFKEKISLEQLSIDIYNGTGCVKDLHLDCDALNEQLDASLASASPIHIVSGFVGYISVCIPWHDLFSDSCKLVVKNVQVTIRTKQSLGVPQPQAHFSDAMANSMFSSVIIDSLMNTSMHIAQECLGEHKLDECKAPLLGLEAFASTIDSILSRIQISLEQIQIRVEHLDKQKGDLSKSSAPLFSQEWSASGIALELRIKSIKYFDEESASGQDSLPTRNTTKNFCIQGLTVYFDEFMVRDDLEESRSDSSPSSSAAANEEAPADECPPFNFDLDPNYYLYTSPVILVTFAGVQSVKLTINNMRPTDLMLEATSPGNQVAGQQRPFLQVSAQFGAIKCLLCPKQIHLLTDMVDKLVDYMDSVQRMKQEFKLNMMKKKTGVKNPVRGETSCEPTTDYCTLISSTDSDNFKSIYQAASDGTSESAMFYSMMGDSKPASASTADHHHQSFSQQLKQSIEQLQNDPIKLTSNHNLFQTFKVTLRQLSLTVLHRDPPPTPKAPRLIVQRIKPVSDFYFDWSSTIAAHSDIRPECIQYHQACAFNDHFLLLLKPITISLTQKINERTKAQHYSLNDLALSIGYAHLNEYLNTKPVGAAHSFRSSGALDLSRSAQITELVHFSSMPIEQACVKAHVTVYEPSEPSQLSHDLLARSFDNIALTVNQSLAVELDISIVDRLFYILNDTGKMRSSGDVTAKSGPGHRMRNVEVKCEQCVKVGVRFPIADLSRTYQTNIVHSDKATAQSFRMKSMAEFRNLREQILTVHLFDVGLETVQNRKAEESDVVMRVSASQVNAYYQFSREERPIHFGLVERCGTEQPHCVVAQIKVPLHVQPASERLEAREERDTMLYEHGINVSRAMNENESDADEDDEVKCGPFSSTYTVISSEKNRRIVNAGTKPEMDAFANHSMQNSHVTIDLDIARVKLLVTDQYFLNDIYNCVLNDLLMFVPSVLGPIESSMYQFDSVNKCFVAPSLSQLIEADMDTDFFATNSINLHGELADEHCFHQCQPAALSPQDPQTDTDTDSDNDNQDNTRLDTKPRASRARKNMLCVRVKVDMCHLKCMVVGEKVSDGIKHGEFDVKAGNFQMCITNLHTVKEHDQQQPNEKQLMSIYADKIELGHENKVSHLKLPSNYASFDALFQTSTTRPLVGQNEPAVSQTLFSSSVDAPSLSIAIKSKYKPSANKKEVVVALNFNNLCLRHVFTEPGNFWIFQLIDLFNLSDIAVAGYQVPLVVTELHLNVANSSVLYEPVHLNTRAFVGFKSLHWSSNVTAESSSTLLVFNIEDIYLFLSRVVHSDKCDLKQDFVCVANTDLFELRILINDERPESEPKSASLDIKIRSNLIQFRTCVDSAFALIELINYIVSDGDLRCDQADSPLSLDLHQSLTTPSLTADTAVISDMVKEAMHPAAHSHDESRDQSPSASEFHLDEPFAQRKLVFKKRDDHYQSELFDLDPDDDDDDDEDKNLVNDFDIIDVVAGLGEPPRFNQHFEIKTLTSNQYQIREDHFKKPLTKIDVLKAPDAFPCPLNVFSIQELSVNWFLYAGTDFEASARQEGAEQCESVSPSVSYSSSSSVQFSKAGGRIVKKYDNLTWLTRGGQGRNLDICMEIALHKVKTKCDIYADLSETAAVATDSACLYRIALAVGDVVIRDKLSTSSFNKFLFRYESDAYPSNANSNMVFFKFLCSRSMDAQRLLECDIKVSIEPLRFAIDQDSLVFLIEFFSQLASKDLKVDPQSHSPAPTPALSLDQDSSLNKGQTEAPPQIYIRNFILAPDLFIKFDFSGKYDKRPDTKMDTLTKLLMVVVQLSNTEIKLKRVYYRRGFLGIDKLMHALVKEWIGDIQRNQIKNLIKGWGIFNSVIQFFEGFAYLILCPIEQYKRDGRVLFGIRKGSAAFSTCTVLATIELTNRMFQATKNVAEFFYDLVAPHRPANMIGHGSAIVDTLFTGVGPNRYVRIRRQPNDIREGLANAYYVLYEGFSDTAAQFMSEVSHGCEHKGLPGAIGGALRQLPPTALAPIVLTAEATCNILSGIRKQLKPDEKKDDDQKWKAITFN